MTQPRDRLHNCHLAAGQTKYNTKGKYFAGLHTLFNEGSGEAPNYLANTLLLASFDYVWQFACQKHFHLLDQLIINQSLHLRREQEVKVIEFRRCNSPYTAHCAQHMCIDIVYALGRGNCIGLAKVQYDGHTDLTEIIASRFDAVIELQILNWSIIELYKVARFPDLLQMLQLSRGTTLQQVVVVEDVEQL